MSLLDRAARFIDDVLLLPEDVRSAVEEAERALGEGEPERAEYLLRDVLEDRPSLLRARQGLALALRAQNDIEGARAILAVSRQLDPDEPEVALLSARLALEAGDVAVAVEESRDAARRLAREGGPAFADACVIRARAERARGRPDRAARELRKAVAAEPELESLRLELAEALAESGRGAAAAGALRGVEVASLNPAVATRIGVALYRAGEERRARELLERGADAGNPEALRTLALSLLARGLHDEAEARARLAIAKGGGPPALSTLAEVLVSEGRSRDATEALLTASEALGGDAEMLRRAARISPLDDASLLERIADRLDGVSPEEPAARAARAWGALVAGALDRAQTLADTDARGEPRLLLAQAAVQVRRADPLAALQALGRASRLPEEDRPRARAIRRDALRLLWRGTTEDVDLAAAIDEVARFAQEQELHDVQRRAQVLRDELDRPLLLAILGEFNAGKSTLVNAFVGADVAPTGILPTTATLNVLRGGAERRVRLVRKDGTTREGDYDQLKQMLEDAEEEETAIDHVEIVLPSELLERVWILDTPGSNAPVPEHEALAAEALRRADAALWIFDSGQAGKATEGKILKAIRASRRHVVAALNKVDRLKPEQLQKIHESLAEELPEIGDSVVALSAKRALKSRLKGDDEGWEASGFPRLLERLEIDVFNRSRQLKRRACGGRLLALLDDALATEEDAVATSEQELAELADVEEPLAKARLRLLDTVDEAVSAFDQTQTEAFEAAAVEVLSFVRPRTNRLGRHGADLEDRAFLAEVIEARLDRALSEAERALIARVRGLLAEPTARLGLSPDSLERRVRGSVSPALARFAGFQSGVLAGGALRRFFEDELPRAELAKEPLAEALMMARAHPRERLRPALREALDALGDELERERQRRVEEVREGREQLRDRLYEPLRALREVLEELVD